MSCYPYILNALRVLHLALIRMEVYLLILKLKLWRLPIIAKRCMLLHLKLRQLPLVRSFDCPTH